MTEIRLEDLDVVRNEERDRFEVVLGGDVAVATYDLRDDRMDITHVGVPNTYRHQGLGGKLARTALEFAREEGLKVRPVCPFAKNYIEDNPEYRDLVAS